MVKFRVPKRMINYISKKMNDNSFINSRTQTLGKPTPSQIRDENHPIFGKLKIHTCNQVLFKVQKYTKNIAPCEGAI